MICQPNSQSELQHLHSLRGELVAHHHLGESWVWLDTQWVWCGVVSVPQRDLGAHQSEELSVGGCLQRQALVRSSVR